MLAARRLQRTALAFRGTLLALGLLGIACYRPNVTPGGFLCKADAGIHTCPEGFACAGDGKCWPPGHDAGSDLKDGGGDADGRPDVPPDATPDADASLPCFDAGTTCDPSDAGVCDPVCQARCGCREKCVVNSTGTAACVMAPSGVLAGIGKTCALGADDCQPGLVCQADNCSSRCYKYCNSDLDCTGATCTRAAPGGYKVCDVPFVDCNPVGSSDPACGASFLACYVSAQTVDRTVCDCPGSGTEGAACTNSRDCLAGLLCTSSQCRRVCRLDSPICPGGPSTCSRYFNNTSTTFGYCF